MYATVCIIYGIKYNTKYFVYYFLSVYTKIVDYVSDHLHDLNNKSIRSQYTLSYWNACQSIVVLHNTAPSL